MGLRTDWFLLSLLALLSWGMWGIFAKLALNHVGPLSAYIYGIAGSVVVSIAVFAFMGFRADVHPAGMIFAALAGAMGTTGLVFFFFATKRGSVSVVVTMTALYPIVTILLSALLLREHITIKQAAGLLFALLAIFLFSS